MSIPDGEVIRVTVLPSETVQLVHLQTGTTLKAKGDEVVLEEGQTRLTEIFPQEPRRGYTRSCLTPDARTQFWKTVTMLRRARALQQRAGRRTKELLELSPQKTAA